MPESSTTNGGLGCLGTLFVIFLVLKLTGLVAWSWWWVLAPLWGPFALVVAIYLLLLLWVVCARVVRGLSK